VHGSNFASAVMACPFRFVSTRRVESTRGL
jgi:hypothetical protein